MFFTLFLSILAGLSINYVIYKIGYFNGHKAAIKYAHKIIDEEFNKCKEEIKKDVNKRRKMTDSTDHIIRSPAFDSFQMLQDLIDRVTQEQKESEAKKNSEQQPNIIEE